MSRESSQPSLESPPITWEVEVTSGTRESSQPSLAASLVAVGLVSAVLTLGISQNIPVVILMILNCVILAVVSLSLKIPYARIEAGVLKGVRGAIITPLILILAGALIASWIQCGTVPMLIYYGLGFMSAQVILPLTFVLCSLLCLCIGTSWGTMGTVGVACVSIGVSMGIPLPMVVGAAISGAILGDKLSPISDTTVLAATTSDINIFSHVSAMLKPVAPTFVICLVGYYFLGRPYAERLFDAEVAVGVRAALASSYQFSSLLLLPMATIIALSVKRVPALATLLISGLAGSLLAVIVQGVSWAEALSVMNAGFKSATGLPLVDTMLSKGGITSMLPTVAIVMTSLAMGGILDEVGYLRPIVEKIKKRIKSDRAAILATIATGIVIVMLVTNFSAVMVLLGSMFRDFYDERNIHRSMLSRSMEDSTTLMLPLVPWNTSCIYYMGLFGLASPTFAPYTFFCWGNLLISVVFVICGVFIRKTKSPEDKFSGAM